MLEIVGDTENRPLNHEFEAAKILEKKNKNGLAKDC